MNNKKAIIVLLILVGILSVARAILFPSPRFLIDRDEENAYTEYLNKNNINQK